MKKRQPSVRQLEYFVTVARSANFRRAAEKLGISQPTLTNQLAALEHELGNQLFERSKAGTLLSPAGRELLPAALAVLEEYQGLLARSESFNKELTGIFHVGVSPTIGPYLLPRVLPGLHRRYGKLRLHLREAPSRQLEKGLEEGEYDFVLTVLPMNTRGNVVRHLFVEPIAIVVSAEHPLAAQQWITGKDLYKQDVLTIDEDHHLHRDIQKICERFGARIQRNYEGTSLDTLRNMVVMGMGVAFLPALYVESEIRDSDDLKVVKLQGEKLTRTHIAAWRPHAASRHLFQKISFDIKAIALEHYRGVIETLPAEPPHNVVPE